MSFAVIGTFDGVHRGHRYLFDQVKILAGAERASTIAFTFDRHPLAVVDPDREPAALTTLEERCRLIANAGIDRVEVLPFSPRLRSLTAAEFVSWLRDQYGVTDLMLGFNQTIGSDRVKAGSDQWLNVGIQTGVRVYTGAQAPPCRATDNICSSEVRAALSRGNVEAAQDILGRPYRLEGTVVDGQHIGRTIGFPTANLRPLPPNAAVPAPGVYAVRAVIDGRARPAMANIGYRPTVDHSEKPHLTIEIHLINFRGNLYNRSIAVDFMARLRDERKFDSLDDLQQRLQHDRNDALRRLDEQS